MYSFVDVGCMVTNYWRGSMSKVDTRIFVCIHWFRNWSWKLLYIMWVIYIYHWNPLAEKLRERGWFPRRCAVEIYENGDVSTNASEATGEQELSKKKENWSRRIFWYSEHRNANVKFTQNHVNKNQVVTLDLSVWQLYLVYHSLLSATVVAER